MTSRKVNQFKCDHCGKRGLSASHMARHERHCTKNPNRICRVCKMIDQDQPKMVDLLNTLPETEDVKVMLQCGHEDGETVEKVMRICLPELRKAAGECPACMMAALRQRGIPVPCADGFNFTEEMNDIWNEINDDQAREEERFNYTASYFGNL